MAAVPGSRRSGKDLLSAELIAERSFPVARRGFERADVQEFLRQVGDAVGNLHTRLEEAEEARQEAEDRAKHPDISEDVLMARVGEETAAILRSARAAAADMQTRAGDEAARVVDEAHQQAGTIRSEAEAAMARSMEEANRAADDIRTAAQESADQTVERARQEVESLRQMAEQERKLTVEGAQSVREKILADLTRRRRVATVQIEQLRAGRERLLESYDQVRRTLHEINDDLQRADAEARSAADEAGRVWEQAELPDLPPDLLVAFNQPLHMGTFYASPPEPGVGVGLVGDEPSGEVVLSEGAVVEAEVVPEVEVVLAAEAEVAAEVEAEAEVEPEVEAEAEVEPEVEAPAAPETVPEADAPAGVDEAAPAPVDEAAPAPVDEAAPAPVDEDGPSTAAEEPRPARNRAKTRRKPARSPAPRRPATGDEEPTAPTEAVAPDAVAPDPAGADDAGVPPPGSLFDRIRAGREEAVQQARATLSAADEPGPDEPAPVEAAPAESAAAPDPVTVQADPVTGAEDPGPEGGRSSEDEELLERRDTLVRDLEVILTRKLKRALQDEQNALLDKLRSARGEPSMEALLGSADHHEQRYLDVALPQLELAAREGARFAAEVINERGGSTAPKRAPKVDDLARELAATLGGHIRRRVEVALGTGGGDDPSALMEALGAAYREIKTQRVESSAGDQAVGAFSRGIWETAGDRIPLRWVVEDVDGPCADCDDNALAGALPRHEGFPTGQAHPPAHAGCRCLLVPQPA